jgi:hypothetical protein
MRRIDEGLVGILGANLFNVPGRRAGLCFDLLVSTKKAA